VNHLIAIFKARAVVPESAPPAVAEAAPVAEPEIKKPVNGHSVKNIRRGIRSFVPEHFKKLSDAVRAGIDLERAGMRLDNVPATIGLTRTTYLHARDVVLLADRTDLSEWDKGVVKAALKLLDETRQYREAEKRVQTIALKVWGRKGHRFKSDKRRLTEFLEAVSFIVTTTAAAREIPVPLLGKPERAEAHKQVKEAILNLRKLNRRIGV
jgi:hypothetical protein